jgi:XTP/dITP diphosphohydrolase
MKLYLASGNAHKAAELQGLATAGGLNVEIVSARAVGGMPEVVEDTGTFVGNARKKALALRAKLPADAWALADDSGLCVDALGGGPGVESAYFAGPQGDGAANLAKIVSVMREVPEGRRGAKFVCVLLCAGRAERRRFSRARARGGWPASRRVARVLVTIRCLCRKGMSTVLRSWATR